MYLMKAPLAPYLAHFSFLTTNSKKVRKVNRNSLLTISDLTLLYSQIIGDSYIYITVVIVYNFLEIIAYLILVGYASVYRCVLPI